MAHIEIFVKNKGQSRWKFIGEASHALRYSFKLWADMEKKYLHPFIGAGWSGEMTAASRRSGTYGREAMSLTMRKMSFCPQWTWLW